MLKEEKLQTHVLSQYIFNLWKHLQQIIRPRTSIDQDNRHLIACYCLARISSESYIKISCYDINEIVVVFD
jgi:hypothetical protein